MPLSSTKGKTSLKPFKTPKHWLELATDLLSLPTSPFHEQNVMQRLMGLSEERGLTHWFDSANNLFVQYQGSPPPRRHAPTAGEPLGPGMMAISAHVDHPGFWAVGMVGKLDLEAQWMGSVPKELFVGSKVVFWTPQTGPDAALPCFHLGGERVFGKIVKILSLDEFQHPIRVKVRVERPVAPGSIGMWDLPDPAIKDGKLYARGIDDVAGAASLMCVLDELVRTQSEHWLLGIFTRAEEGGFFGCIDLCRQMSAAGAEAASHDSHHRRAAPARIIGLETSKRLPNAQQGDGPIVRVGDRKLVFNPAIAGWEVATAEKLAKEDPTFRWQRKLMDGGTCETSVYQAYGFSAGALAIPLGNYHNIREDKPGIGSEFVDVSDFGNLVRLQLALVENYHAMRPGANDFRTWCDNWHGQHKHLFGDPAGKRG